MPMDVVVHPRDLNLVFLAYGGNVQPLSPQTDIFPNSFDLIGGIILFDLVRQSDSWHPSRKNNMR